MLRRTRCIPFSLVLLCCCPLYQFRKINAHLSASKQLEFPDRKLPHISNIGLLPIGKLQHFHAAEMCVYFPELVLVATDAISYRHYSVPPELSAHILEIDPTKIEMRLVQGQEKNLGVETTSSMVKRTAALGGINAGFFHGEPYLGLNAGILKIENRLFTSTDRKRGAFGFDHEGLMLIDRLDSVITLCREKDCFHIDYINAPLKPGRTVLYTDEIDIPDKPPQDSKAIILSHHPASELTVTLLPILRSETQDLWNACSNIIGGTPVLIYDNHLIEDFYAESIIVPFVEQKYPRTALGILPNGHLLVVMIEGFVPFKSNGMTLHELQQFMHFLGAQYALNLDGGHSSTFCYEDILVASKKIHGEDNILDLDTSERLIGSALLFYKK